VATGAPYFHHGKARTLDDVFTPAYATHHQAASANFLPNGGTTVPERAQINDLVAFLKSIDESTVIVPLEPTQNICVGY